MAKFSAPVIALGMLFLPILVFADTIILKDGVRGTGFITKVTPDTLYFMKSGGAGVVAISRGLVARFDVDEGISESGKSSRLPGDSMKSTTEVRQTPLAAQSAANDGAEIRQCHMPNIPDGCTAFTLVYKGSNFEIGETPTISLIRDADFRENPYPRGIGFRAGGFASAGWGAFFAVLGGLMQENGVAYTGLALLGNSAVMLTIGYMRKSRYIRWEERHPFKQPVTEDSDDE